MRLKNKHTGEVIEWEHGLQYRLGKEYNSIKEFAEDWEDYEEPKSINEIDVIFDAIAEYCNEHSYYSEDLDKIKILNIAEEKLKAWKRLKDNLIDSLLDIEHDDLTGDYHANISFSVENYPEAYDDLKLFYEVGK